MKLKKYFNYSLLALAATVVFASCDDLEDIVDEIEGDEDIELIVEGTVSDNVTVFVSDLEVGATSFNALVKFTAGDEDMKRLYITENYFGAGDEPYELTGVDVDTKGDGSLDLEKDFKEAFTFDIPFTVYDTETTGEVVYTLWATYGNGDYRDNTKRLAVGLGTITVDYGGSNPATDVKEYSAKLLAAPLADGSSESFISLLDGELYQIDEGVEYVAFWDFGYYYGNSNKASLASTSDYPTSIVDIMTVAEVTDASELNDCFFAISSMDFDAVTKSTDLSSITKSSTQAINELAVDDVIEFVDNYGKKGLIKVVEIEGTFGTDDYIKLDIKVQP